MENISKLVLLALNLEEKTPNEICHIIENEMLGELSIKQSALSKVLSDLEFDGYLLSRWDGDEKSGMERKYFVTNQGENEILTTEDTITSLARGLTEEEKEQLIGTTPDAVKPATENIKRLDESDRESENKSIYQFDLFGQNIKLVKDTAKSHEKIEAVQGKIERGAEPVGIEPKDNAENLSTSVFNFVKEKTTTPTPRVTTQTHAISWEKGDVDTPIFENNDYRAVIGKLYTDSQMQDPYEQNKFHNFKEIFPTASVEEVKEVGTQSEMESYISSSKDGDINCDDIDMLTNLFNLQGIDIKKHNKDATKQNETYTNKNRLNMFSAWIVSFFMICELVFSYFILKTNGNLLSAQRIIYYLGGALVISIFSIFTLENMFDRFKLVILKPSFKKDFAVRLLLFFFAVAIIFAVCFMTGMQNVGQVEFLSFWLVPILLSTNIFVSYLVYFILLKSKNFDC